MSLALVACLAVAARWPHAQLRLNVSVVRRHRECRGGPKPPVTVTCTSTNANGAGSQLGTESNQLFVGCVGSASKAHVTPTASVIPDVATSSATIYWTNKKITTESFSYAGGGTCPTYLGLTASTVVTVTSTVTGGNPGLTVGQSFKSVNCLYSAGSDLLCPECRTRRGLTRPDHC